MGKNIALERNRNHLTQEQLAEMVDVSTVFISQLETSVRKPSLETIYKLSVALNTTIDSLVGSETPQSRNDEIARLIAGRTKKELSFITTIIREICTNIENDKIK